MDSKLRIGIWCAYHITLEPSEGIGVFAHNIARGLARQPEVAGVDLMCRSGDVGVVRETVAKGGGKIRAVELPGGETRIHRRIRRTVEKLHRFSVRQECRAHDKWLAARDRAALTSPADQRSRSVRRKLARLVSGRKVVSRIRKCQYRSWFRSSRVLSNWCSRLNCDIASQTDRLIQQCDAWLIPYVGLDRAFPTPTVVAIHDLVCIHFPEMLSPKGLEEFERMARQVAAQSTVAACMSNFIAENDLRGVLSLPEEKVRVVAPAAPRDFGTAADLDRCVEQYPVLRQPFIFYPSAFRLYKNHAALVEALALLAAQGDRFLQLVFTGIHDIPSKLRELIQRRGLEQRVHVLGKVPRDVLCQFYRQARATIVPSLYEQGSYPLMEAMYWECPIAAADIPSLRELFACMGEDMLFFDPHCPRDLAATIARVLHHRGDVLRDQQRHRQAVFGRTWEQAAGDWLQVIKYAIRRHAELQGTRSVARPAA